MPTVFDESELVQRPTRQHRFPRKSCIQCLQALVAKQADFMPDPTFLDSVQDKFMTPSLRARHVDWFYEENDKMDFDSETPAIALNFLERYLSRKKVSKQELHIAMCASFSLATRVHESILMAITPGCKNGFASDDVKLMEAGVLEAIEWRVHPVTSSCIAQNVLALLPLCKGPLSHQRKEDVDMLLCAAIGQYYLLCETPSTLALAAVLAASTYSHLPTQSVWDLIEEIGSCIDDERVKVNSEEMLKLLTMYDNEPSAECSPERKNTESPTGVQDLYLNERDIPHPPMMPTGPANDCAISDSQKRAAGGLCAVSAKKPKLDDGYASPFQSSVTMS